MIIEFNKLEITPNGQNLNIDISVKNLSYYTNVYISKVKIDSQSTYVSTGPSSSPLYTYECPAQTKQLTLNLTQGNVPVDFNTNLLIVYVELTGTPDSSTPCGEDSLLSIGVVMNLYNIYTNIILYIKELTNTCNVPKDMIDGMIRIMALKMAIKTNHITEAVKLWNDFFTNINLTSSIDNCSCNG